MQARPYRPVAIFLNPKYLSKAFSGSERLQCHQHNFSFLCERFSPFHLLDIFAPGLTLFSRKREETSVSCLFSVEQKASNQGELSLTLIAQGEAVYVLSFNFVPGKIFSVADATVILIARMQGMAQSYDRIRLATKMFADISPQALLFAALQGVADRFAIRYIFGVSARLQSSSNVSNVEQLKRGYDDFYAAAGAAPAGAGYYVYDRSGFTDIFDNMPAKHRARTKVKRRLKASLAIEVADALAPYALADPAARSESLSHFVAAQFSTRVGQRLANGIATSGKAGCLLFGPYVYLEAGAYEAEYLLDASGEPADFVLDIIADRGAVKLARKDVGGWRGGDPVGIAFEIAEPRDEVEFRLFVSAEAAFAARGVQLRRLPAPAAPA